MNKNLITVKEVAEILRASEIWVKRLVKQKKIPSYKIAGKRLFDKAEIMEWIESQKNGGDK